MACINWHTVISVVIVLTVKAVGTTFFLLYLPQIFPPVLEENFNSTSTERSTTVPWTSPITFEENFKYFTTEASRTVCPIRWDLYKGRCYFFSTNERNWEDSRNQCTNEGATLAVINNKEEQKFLQERAGTEIYFMGLRYQISLGSWQWIDGSEFMIKSQELQKSNYSAEARGGRKIFATTVLRCGLLERKISFRVI
ncbi:C-type lectin domain family 5 member A isoform X3 [Sarcophilus harrisii]|uniref:C-type lectin domain family 5 member A isoform X3 n=1 Tax=Sarcophilus harrisii TaxID=9305 RepID=UPI001301F9D3|nr:C-type lectin domain family 5 member A isoform X3 [Sarcophilus harrisii]